MNTIDLDVKQNKQIESQSVPTGRLKGLTRENGALVYQGILVREMLAYPLGLAALLVGLSYTTFWKEVKLGRIRVTPRKLVSRAELERYLESQLADPAIA